MLCHAPLPVALLREPTSSLFTHQLQGPIQLQALSATTCLSTTRPRRRCYPLSLSVAAAAPNSSTMSSANAAFLNKPETALRRAEELISINQPNAALALLHEVLSSRRHKTWSTTYEKIIILYLDLCLQLNRSREAKDGLHQYRNLSQSQAPGSLELVIRHLIDSSEKRCRLAKEAADKGEDIAPFIAGDKPTETIVSPNTEGVDEDGDDDAFFDAPQSIMLSTMSTDPEKVQRDTAVLLPALKFLWEVYRAVLDILKSNSKLEKLYHSSAQSALKFCGEYKRRVEFRRLCDMMRMHLGNLQKYGGVTLARIDEAGKLNNKVRCCCLGVSSISLYCLFLFS